MLAGGAELGSLLGLDDETAVAALPPDLAVALEEIAVREAAQQLQVAALVLGLDGGDHLEGRGDLDEALLLGDFGEFAVEDVPLLLLALGCGQQVLGRGADRAGGVARRDLHVTALEELEETLGVLLLLLGSLGEDTRDLLVTLLLRLAREEDVTAARLALTGKRLQQILFSPCSFNALFHNPVCLMCVFIFR